MSKVMIVVGSVREGRVGLSVAEWVKSRADSVEGLEVDFVDLKELALPFMTEPNHPAKRAYTQPETIAWSKRVDAADAFIFVSPEYNHSYSPALKNAIDYLNYEWWRKSVGFVSYGGVSGGSRGVAALDPVLPTIGLVKAGANVEIPFVGTMIHDGAFVPSDKESAILDKMLAEIVALSEALRPLRAS